MGFLVLVDSSLLGHEGEKGVWGPTSREYRRLVHLHDLEYLLRDLDGKCSVVEKALDVWSVY